MTRTKHRHDTFHRGQVPTDQLGAGTADDTTFLRGDQTWQAGAGGGAPTTADYLVGTAQAGLSAEIVVGATPGGELAGTWASPTVDAAHSGSTHAAAQAAAEATAAAALTGHTGDTGDAHDASAISFTPAGTIAATDVQAAIEEVAAEAGGSHPDLATHDTLGLATQAELDAHTGDTADAHDASAVSIVDAGAYFTGVDVEAALQELGAGGGGVTPEQVRDAGHWEVLMTPGITDPPDPLTTNDGADWIYGWFSG